MSWNDYVNLLFIEQKQENGTFIKNGCCGGAIIGKNGQVWAQAGVDFSKDVPKIVQSMADPNNNFPASGLKVGVTKYMYLNSPLPDVWAFKNGNLGACIANGKQCFIVGVSDAKSVVNNCTNNVNLLHQLLAKNGF